MYISNDALNHFWVHSRAKDCLRSAKNVVFFLVLHFGRQADKRVAIAPASSGCATAMIDAETFDIDYILNQMI